MIFKDSAHKKKYEKLLSQMNSNDNYHTPLAYLLALDDNLTHERIRKCFDFDKDCIHSDVLEEAWITGTNRRTLKLAFNLFNDNNSCNVSDICGCSFTAFYLQAIALHCNISL